MNTAGNSMVPLLRLNVPMEDQTLSEYFGILQSDLPYVTSSDGYGTPKINGCNFLALGTQIPELTQYPRSPYMDYHNPYNSIGILQRSGEQYLPASRRTGKQIFRSKHRGICPLGWVSGPNGLCLPENTSERDGMFYKAPPSTLYGFSDCTLQNCYGSRN